MLTRYPGFIDEPCTDSLPPSPDILHPGGASPNPPDGHPSPCPVHRIGCMLRQASLDDRKEMSLVNESGVNGAHADEVLGISSSFVNTVPTQEAFFRCPSYSQRASCQNPQSCTETPGDICYHLGCHQEPHGRGFGESEKVST